MKGRDPLTIELVALIILTLLFIVAFVGVLLDRSRAEGAELRLTAQLPCFKPSYSESTGCLEDTLVVEQGLDSLLVWGRRFRDTELVFLGGISVRGRDCDSVPVVLDLDPGSMGELLVYLQTTGGALGCRPFSYVFAMPAIDSTLSLLRDYDLILKR